jgi:hypothetical protein
MRVGVLDNEKQLKDDAQDLRFLLICRVSVAAGEGFEPSLTDPESVVLPLHHPAKGNGAYCNLSSRVRRI